MKLYRPVINLVRLMSGLIIQAMAIHLNYSQAGYIQPGELKTFLASKMASFPLHTRLLQFLADNICAVRKLYKDLPDSTFIVSCGLEC